MKLTRLLKAFGRRLTGDQLAECLSETWDRYATPVSLSDAEEHVLRSVLDDEGVAAYYGKERNEGLEALRERQRKLDNAYRHLIAPSYSGEWNLRGALTRLQNDASDLSAHFDAALKAAQEALKKEDGGT